MKSKELRQLSNLLTKPINRMTIIDLITELEKYPEDMEVVRPGYEGGYTDNLSLEVIKIKRNVNNEPWYGPHNEDETGEEMLVL